MSTGSSLKASCILATVAEQWAAEAEQGADAPYCTTQSLLQQDLDTVITALQDPAPALKQGDGCHIYTRQMAALEMLHNIATDGEFGHAMACTEAKLVWALVKQLNLDSLQHWALATAACRFLTVLMKGSITIISGCASSNSNQYIPRSQVSWHLQKQAVVQGANVNDLLNLLKKSLSLMEEWRWQQTCTSSSVLPQAVHISKLGPAAVGEAAMVLLTNMAEAVPQQLLEALKQQSCRLLLVKVLTMAAASSNQQILQLVSRPMVLLCARSKSYNGSQMLSCQQLIRMLVGAVAHGPGFWERVAARRVLSVCSRDFRAAASMLPVLQDIIERCPSYTGHMAVLAAVQVVNHHATDAATAAAWVPQLVDSAEQSARQYWQDGLDDAAAARVLLLTAIARSNPAGRAVVVARALALVEDIIRQQVELPASAAVACSIALLEVLLQDTEEQRQGMDRSNSPAEPSGVACPAMSDVAIKNADLAKRAMTVDTVAILLTLMHSKQLQRLEAAYTAAFCKTLMSYGDGAWQHNLTTEEVILALVKAAQAQQQQQEQDQMQNKHDGVGHAAAELQALRQLAGSRNAALQAVTDKAEVAQAALLVLQVVSRLAPQELGTRLIDMARLFSSSRTGFDEVLQLAALSKEGARAIASVLSNVCMGPSVSVTVRMTLPTFLASPRLVQLMVSGLVAHGSTGMGRILHQLAFRIAKAGGRFARTSAIAVDIIAHLAQNQLPEVWEQALLALAHKCPTAQKALAEPQQMKQLLHIALQSLDKSSRHGHQQPLIKEHALNLIGAPPTAFVPQSTVAGVFTQVMRKSKEEFQQLHQDATQAALCMQQAAVQLAQAHASSR
eukprot:gene12560-12693_t